MKDSKLPTLTGEDIKHLERPIETSQVIIDLKAGKSPGPDGFSSIYYKIFINILTGPLTEAVNSLSNPREVSLAFLSAFITVIYKPNEDPVNCTSYRPISFLNLDVKLLAKIVATRLRPLLHGLIGPEQAGFMPGREAKDNQSNQVTQSNLCCLDAKD